MKTIQTKSGTHLPILSLKGKDYLQVPQRMVWFREEHPLGRFETECLESTDKYVLYKATISVPDATGRYIKLADAVKREDFSHFPDAHEKAQTGAIGRALAMIGYGTAFAPEFDEGERLADSPLPPKSGAENPIQPQVGGFYDENPFPPAELPGEKPSDGYVIGFGKFKGKTLKEVPIADLQNYADYLERSSVTTGKPISPGVADFIHRVRNL